MKTIKKRTKEMNTVKEEKNTQEKATQSPPTIAPRGKRRSYIQETINMYIKTALGN